MSMIPPRPDLPAPATPGGPGRVASSELGSAPTWSPWAAIGVYVLGAILASYLAVLVAVAIGTGGTADVTANVIAAIGVAALVAAWLRVRHASSIPAVGLSAARRARDLAWGFGFGLVLYPAVAFGAAIVIGLLLQIVTGAEVSAPQQVPSGLDALGVGVVVLYAVVVAPIAEEFFFRGVLLSSMAARWGFWPGAFASGVLFGLIHYVPAPWPDAVLLMSAMVPTGMAMAWARRRRGSLYASIGAHAAFNVVGLSFIYVFS